MKGEIIEKKYKIIKVLGQDFCSETFLAQGKGLYSFHRYAIKKFKPILGDPQVRKIRDLFEREASILKLLSGKNRQIPQLHEYFVDGEDFYLVREWIEGVTLEQKVRQQGKLPETEVKQILASILEVLQHIHNYGIVYRELSPSSIILRQNHWLNLIKDRECLPIPIYFGGVEELESQTQRLNQPSLLLANQHQYIPPEKELGKSLYASDLYSLGLTAIYLLTGKTPAELDCDLYNHKLLWQQDVPDISANLVRAINRSICTKQSDRFASAEEMSQALFPQSIDISESLITQTEKKSWLTSEVKIVSTLMSSGLGILGIAFAMLNFDFDLSLKDNNSLNPTQDKSSDVASLQEASKNNTVEALSSTTTVSSIPQEQAVLNIPAFRVGVPLEQIIDSLGKPTYESKGYWNNSRAFLYADFIPDRVDLGYLSDLQTQTIHQTEVSFAESVGGIEIENTLKQLLMTDYSVEIEQKVKRVIQKKSDKQEFRVNNLEGIIQRNAQNHIYVAVWKSGFHQ
ncbi:serine/threonine protein kinase [Waterburya agarophytonicola K14]|uniref:non-specific serine/threonine protein kinase n=1 Tax=Waterburya agarophytonicola KI4 TaxID=2874699 RepID=A0A964BTG7_9CYAN|nr:serine/threonine-protein kinase [Waterburya agarophytonicola]MCC0177872.1 serine/threonine protein kinase [Waterburya agarophytonicola KI4]